MINIIMLYPNEELLYEAGFMQKIWDFKKSLYNLIIIYRKSSAGHIRTIYKIQFKEPWDWVWFISFYFSFNLYCF